MILAARALPLWHPSVVSRVAEPAASLNLAYFRRRDVPAFCVQGLKAGRQTTEDGRRPEEKERRQMTDVRPDWRRED